MLPVGCAGQGASIVGVATPARCPCPETTAAHQQHNDPRYDRQASTDGFGDWQGWWGDNPPFHTPVFVLTHHHRPSFSLADTTFHFIEATPAEALQQAKEAADGKDVRLGGGVATVRQFLEADLVDTMHVAVAPPGLGRGERLWDSPDEVGTLSDVAGSNASTPEEYLAELPGDRRAIVETVRATILDHLPEGFEETMTFGMLGYVVPLDRFPDTYNGQPLGVISLANQKNHVAVYLMGVYADEAQREWFVDAWADSGKKLDMGKSCVRFKSLDDVALDVLGEAVARVSADDVIAGHEAAHPRR